ncbi:hypothetical protein ACLBVL_35305, partial [Pseudomonas aeruginosa]
MRTLLLAGGLLVLSGCSLLMPTPDPNRAWVDLDTQPPPHPPAALPPHRLHLLKRLSLSRRERDL